MRRHWLTLLSLGILLAVAGCSDDEPNQPPTAEIVYPDPGHHYTSSPDSVVCYVTDDRDEDGASQVEFYLDDVVISTVTDPPWSTRLPLGTYADGLDHALKARATDSSGATGTTGSVIVTIDPSLQTVPQITVFDLDEDGSGQLRLSWLTFPTAVTTYEWEVARDDAFDGIAASGTTTETTEVVAVIAEGLAYARVRAVLPDGATDWSRSARFSNLETWRHRYEADGPQLGAALFQASDGTLRILSHTVDRHRVPESPVQLLGLDANNELAAVHDLYDDSYTPTASVLDADGNLRLAGTRDDGTGFVAAVDLDGNQLWTGAADFMACSALVQEGDAWRTVGVDLDPDAPGGRFGEIGAGGAVTSGPAFALEEGRTVQLAWLRPDGGYVVAGQMPDAEDGQPGGIWIRGLDTAYQELWTLRLGTAQHYLLRGGNSNGDGHYVVTGLAMMEDYFSRFGFALSCDQDGRLRWQVEDRDWHLFAGIEPTAGDRWVTAGVLRHSIGYLVWDYHQGMRGFTDAGETLFETSHQAGEESQGWSLLLHPAGGWWTAGMRTYDYVEYDVDVLRVDDLGELD